LRHLCHNLRHELNYIIQFIINQAVELDPKISANDIDVDNPQSRIVAAALAIDHFIQMVNGVNEFKADSAASFRPLGGSRLSKIIENYFAMYSLMARASMQKAISLKLEVDDKIIIASHRHVICYIISVLIDNAWKYSLDKSELIVKEVNRSESLASVLFENKSVPIPAGLDLFEKGIKADETSRGFGYGLFWAEVLINHYNKINVSMENPLKLTHRQILLGEQNANQEFLLENIRIKR